MGDAIGSGHAPYCRATKEQLRSEAAIGPARVHGVVGKGRLAAGYDADFTLVDMRRTRRIEESWIASPCGWTPFAGMQVTGWPVATIVRGQVVMREDEVLGGPAGRLVAFR